MARKKTFVNVRLNESNVRHQRESKKLCMGEVLKMADRISILRDGDFVTTVNREDVDEDQLKTLMVGRQMDDHYYRTDYPDYAREQPGETAVSVRGVTVPGMIDDISFDLHRGEILGIGGLSECGMHEVGKAIFGASYDRTGEVVLADGTKVKDINTAIDHSIAYASKDRDNESLLINDTIEDNIALPSMRDMRSRRDGKDDRADTPGYRGCQDHPWDRVRIDAHQGRARRF